jgi:D-tyrosyl-tRNA(Tyr) deacylase
MRLVIQRVKKANVKVGAKVVGEIENGLFVLVGVSKEDTKKDAEELAEKLAKLRVMADKEGKMNLAVKCGSENLGCFPVYSLRRYLGWK